MSDDPFDGIKAISKAWYYLSEAQAELKYAGCLRPDVRGQLETLKITVASMEEDARLALSDAIKEGEILAPSFDEE